MSKSFKIVNGDISDGYHTFDELYSHRVALYLVVLNSTNYYCALKKDHYEGWDAVYLELPAGQISYHIPSKFRNMLPCRIKVVTSKEEYPFDGHTSNEVMLRLLESIVVNNQTKGEE